MQADLAELKAALGYPFRTTALLERALIHSSLLNEHAADLAAEAAEPTAAPGEDSERLEFLGDAILGLVVAEFLFAEHPEWREGELTRVRAQLVSRQHLAQVAEAIDLGNYLRLGRGEEKSGLRRKGTVLSNTMEAVLGAIFVDGGLEPVRAFARRHILGDAATRLADELRSGAALGNYKSALQEYLQSSRDGIPVYKVRGESGPDHRKRFLVEVRLKPRQGEPGKALARGMGGTKKRAEQDAARRALMKLKSGVSRQAGGNKPSTQG
jgi:ribonuclease III